MNEPVIKAKELCKIYDRKIAINSFSIDIPEGGLIGLIGRNGSGKTTLMKLCAGQLNVTGGRLEVLGGAPMDNLMERFDDGIAVNARQNGLRVSPVRPEDLCVYLTMENKEGELECLWQKAN